MGKKEDRLQFEIVMSFSQKHPELRRNLWSTRNQTFSGKDGAKQKSLGMLAGVSDLIYFKDSILTGIEIKTKGSRHKSDHVRVQALWGQNIVENGGKWSLVRSLEGFWATIHDTEHEDRISAENVLKLLTKNSVTF